MKKLIIIMLLIPCVSVAQKKKNDGYLILNVGGIKFEKSEPVPAGSFGLGIKLSKILGIGGGIEFTKLYGDNSMYIPVYFQITGFEKKAKASPFFSGKIGFGAYNNQIKIGSSSISTSGGLYFSPSVGIHIPVSKIGLIFSVSYVGAHFETTSMINNRKSVVGSDANGFAFGLGVRF